MMASTKVSPFMKASLKHRADSRADPELGQKGGLNSEGFRTKVRD